MRPVNGWNGDVLGLELTILTSARRPYPAVLRLGAKSPWQLGANTTVPCPWAALWHVGATTLI